MKLHFGIWDIFYQIYGDIAKEPERFAMPMFNESEYRYGSKETNDSSHSDPGCQNDINGSCRKGVGYIYEGEERWNCGCCSAAFKLHPNTADIPHYLMLVELGAKNKGGKHYVVQR